MKRKRLLLVLLAVVAAGCGGGGGSDGEVVATVGDREITREDLERRLAEMPANVQARFEGEEGMGNLLEGIMDEEAFLLAALEMDLDKNAEVERQIEAARRRVLIQSYYQREVIPYTQMTEEDMIGYYEENLEEFTRPEESEVRQVVTATEREANMARSRLQNGVSWETVINDYCVDLPTKKRSGRIGPVQKNASLIPLVGASIELTQMIDSLTVGKISPVVKTGKGYHVITIEKRNPSTEVPFEKVRETIQRNYANSFADKVRKNKVAALREKYGTEIVGNPFSPAVREDEEKRPAEKLFELAQATSDPQKRIKYYNEIVNNHTDDPYACEARFMIGFVYSEEMHDFDRAREAFQKVIDHPEGCEEELMNNARWMLENMGAEPPEFED